MLRSRAPMAVLLLVALPLAGCIGSSDDEGVAPTATPTAASAYAPIDESRLSQPTFDIGPRVTARLPASIDGIPIFAEYWLPVGDGQWPVIVHSTPYSHLDRPLEAASAVFGFEGYREFFVARGYAFVVADVRGFGESGGCVEVWGPNEQQDQYDLVEWAASQEWSDGNVGMIGVSYPGTTPMEATVMAPPSLKAIIAVAGLTDPYYDWHFGGVPNGESGPAGSPAAYHGIGAVVPFEAAGGADWALAAKDTGCNAAPFTLEAYSPDGTYTDFYAVRNLSARVKDVTAAVLYTQGFLDGNVKPTQALRWFNELDVPKKGIFGPWGHQNPPREDWDSLTLAWFDQHLKGVETGVLRGPIVEVHNNVDRWRADTAFPSARTARSTAYVGTDAIAWAPAAEGSLELATGRTERTLAGLTLGRVIPAETLTVRSEALAEDLFASGVIQLVLHASLEGATNAFLHADLYDVSGDTRTRIAFGELNLALRNGVATYEPMPAGEPVTAILRFQPVEHVVEKGHALELVLRPIDLFGSPTTEASEDGTLTLHTGGEAGTRLVLPVLAGRPDGPRPAGV